MTSLTHEKILSKSTSQGNPVKSRGMVVLRQTKGPPSAVSCFW